MQLSKQIQLKMAQYLLEVSNFAYKGELVKRVIGESENFDLYLSYSEIDRDGKGFISANDLYTFMNRIGVRETVTFIETQYLIRFLNSSDSDRLGYNTYMNTVLPSDPTVRGIASQRCQCKVSDISGVCYGIAQIFALEIKMLFAVDKKRTEFIIPHKYTHASLMFNILDTDRKGYLSFTHLQNLFDQFYIKIQNDQLEALYAKIDRDFDGKITLHEFESIFEYTWISPKKKQTTKLTVDKKPKRDYREYREENSISSKALTKAKNREIKSVTNSPKRKISRGKLNEDKLNKCLKSMEKEVESDIKLKDKILSSKKEDSSQFLNIIPNGNKQLQKSVVEVNQIPKGSPIKLRTKVTRTEAQSLTISPERQEKMSKIGSPMKLKLENEGNIGWKSIIQLLEAQINQERVLEEIRCELALRPDFNIITLFNFLNLKGNGCITHNDFFLAFRDLGLPISAFHVALIFQRFDYDSLQFLKKTNIEEIFLPRDAKYQEIVNNRLPVENCSSGGMRGFETFTRDTQDLIIMYIEELAKKEDNMERQREYLYGLREFKIMEMFYGVCGMDKSQIEIEDIRRLLRDNEIIHTELEVVSLFNRLDKNHDGFISYADVFYNMFIPVVCSRADSTFTIVLSLISIMLVFVHCLPIDYIYIYITILYISNFLKF